MKARLLLIGPCPPPDGGTTIPFKLFCTYIENHFDEQYDIAIINTTTGDKSIKSIFAPVVLLRVLAVLSKILVKGFFSNNVIIFGSQRFATFAGSMVVLLLKPLSKRVCIRINGGGYDLFFKNSSEITKYIIRKILVKADAIVVQTGVVEAAMKKVWPEAIKKVPNYRAFIEFDSSTRIFSKDKITFIYTGIIRKLKGSNELLTAYTLLKVKLIENGYSVKTTLQLYGNLHTSENEKVDIETYQEHPDIIFHGQVNNTELKEAYLNADVFVFPTYWPTEGHSGAVVEAMMYGLPIISTDWRAMSEIVEDGINGLLCRPHDVDNLVDKMYILATDMDCRKRLSKLSRKKSEQFTVDNVCDKFVEIFQLKDNDTMIDSSSKDSVSSIKP